MVRDVFASYNINANLLAISLEEKVKVKKGFPLRISGRSQERPSRASG
jgi:hypothetical protein